MSDAARMNIMRGATYRRVVTWTGQAGDPSLYDAVLVIRHTLNTAAVTLTMNSPPVSGNGITIGFTPGSGVTTTLRLGSVTTATLPVGQYMATLALSLVADPTENWTVSWPVSVSATALQVAQ